MMEIFFKKVHPEAKLPEYAHGSEEDSGMDLRCVEPVTLFPWRTALVRTGLAVEVPIGMEMQIRPRGGLAAKGVRVCNSPGTVDPGFRGEIIIIMRWEPDFLIEHEGGEWKIIKFFGQKQVFSIGSKIAQAVVSNYVRVIPAFAGELSKSERGTGMLGSSGS